MVLALDLLKSAGDRPEFLELLASAYALHGSLCLDTEETGNHSFRLAMHIWSRMLSDDTKEVASKPVEPAAKGAPTKRPVVGVAKLPAKATAAKRGNSRTGASKAATTASADAAEPVVRPATPAICFVNLEQSFADASE